MQYGEPDIHELAAAYAYGFVRKHAFIDGNKRAALFAPGAFLDINGWMIESSQAETVGAMLALADSIRSEDDFARWLRLQTKRRSRE